MLSSAQNTKKWAIFGILLTITLTGVNMITRQMTPFFSSTLWTLSGGIFCFCISRSSKFNFMGSPFSIIFWSVKCKLTCQVYKIKNLPAKYDTFKFVNIDIFFLSKICYLLVYDMFCSQFDTNLVPIRRTKSMTNQLMFKMLTRSRVRTSKVRKYSYNIA